MKKIFSLLIILVLASTGSTCKKKIKKYPFDMYGKWYGTGGYCGQFLTIDKNGTGKLYTPEGSTCLEKSVKGKVKYRKDILFIGNKRFTIFDEPETVTNNDSISVPVEGGGSFYSNQKKYRVLATMKLQPKGIFEFEDTYTFSKIIDY